MLTHVSLSARTHSWRYVLLHRHSRWSVKRYADP